MINDILFCLIGYTGGVFLETDKGFEINQNITTLTQSEKESLIQICELGSKYKILSDFIQNYETIFYTNLIQTPSTSSSSQTDMNSIYLSGVCQTIKDLLSQYRKHIEKLDNKFYREQTLTINDILLSLSPFLIKFDKLYDFLQNIYQNNIKGAQFLNLIFENGITGDPNVKDVFKMLFINCNIVLNNMISNWIINNAVISNEFFIMSSNNFVWKESNSSNNNHLQSTQIQTLSSHSFAFNTNELDSWTSNYYIEKSNVPCYYPLTLVEDILFVGKAIKILNSNKNSEECKISFNDMSIFYTSLQKLNKVVFKQNEDMNNLIDIEIFGKVITLIKNCVSKFLWRLVVDKNGFIGHLNAVKNIFLTFHGEFYYNFICKIQELLNLPNFDKKIENEINDVYFKTAMKEVFEIDKNEDNKNYYSGFKIKLISSGFTYNFQDKDEIRNYLNKKEISFLGGLTFDSTSSSFRLINTTYKSQNGVLWDSSQYDLDEEFLMNTVFTLKNFTQKETFDDFVNHSKHITAQIMKHKGGVAKSKEKSLIKSITINYILHIAKSYPVQPPLNLNDLVNYFNFQFTLTYANNDVPTELTAITFRLYYSNKQKQIILNNNEQGLSATTANTNYQQVNEHEIEIYSHTFENTNTDTNTNASGALSNIIQTASNVNNNNIQILFKENYCTISNESKTLNFSFPFTINQFIPKEKRKVIVGMIISSQNLDMIYENVNWNCNFFSGEIYKENTNLILINYNPPWPHNFIFNENILKQYNYIFNLVFPLKTSLTMLNQLWIEKKNVCNSYVNIFKIVDSVHAEFTVLLQNLISFYMFDVVEVKFNKFFEKISKCKDLEDLLCLHEEFLREVITNSFVKSKRIMRTIFDVLFVVRKFHNYVQKMLVNLDHNKAMYYQRGNSEECYDEFFEKTGQECKKELMMIKEEFNAKVESLINGFTKIKNTNHWAIISQLLGKLQKNNGGQNEF